MSRLFKGFFKRWPVSIKIEQVDQTNHQLRLTTQLPHDIKLLSQISCVAITGSQGNPAYLVRYG
jgi:hypothetical protein